MKLNERIKNFIQRPSKVEKQSQIHPDNVLKDLSNHEIENTASFFDGEYWGNQLYDTTDVVQQQAMKIQTYRQLAMQPDVNDAVDEICNEVIFSYDDGIPLKLVLNSMDINDKLQTALQTSFDKILEKLNIKRNIYQIIKSGYIDGQMVCHLEFSEDLSQGIKSIKLIDPKNLFFDFKDKSYKYFDEQYTGTKYSDKFLYSEDEIVRENFGIYDGNLILGYLEHAIKPANMLKTLEDLLIPLRFSRSISRRVFNVDIGDLPSKRGAEIMRENQAKFRYKKFYNNETGEISNQQHIISMVEDYWFANRNGGKGTTVDVLDETGNLGEIDDIIYVGKKLYRALRVPSNRFNRGDNDVEFSYDATSVSKEDMKFFAFISRLRQVYSSFFKEILKREVLATNVMSQLEFETLEHKIQIIFSEQNKFIEKMQLEAFQSKLDIYSSVEDQAGKLLSLQTILKQVFRFSDEEITAEFERIQKEKNDEKFKRFYPNEEEY